MWKVLGAAAVAAGILTAGAAAASATVPASPVAPVAANVPATYPPPFILPEQPGRCEYYYPYDESTAGIEGQTVLQFTVDEYGSVRDVSVTASSGNAHLDEAAKICAGGWHYKPAVQDGAPVASQVTDTVAWALAHQPAFAEPPKDCPHAYKLTFADLNGINGISDIRFKIVDGEVRDAVVVHPSGSAILDQSAVECVATRRYARTETPQIFRERIFWANGMPPLPGAPARPQSVGPLHLCYNEYPPIAARLGVQGSARVRFTVATDGRIKDARIEQTTGNELLDQASLECVSTWRYWPVVVDGKVVEVSWIAALNWSLR